MSSAVPGGPTGPGTAPTPANVGGAPVNAGGAPALPNEGGQGGRAAPMIAGFASFAEAGMWFGATCGLNRCHANGYPPSLSNADLAALETTLRDFTVARCGGLPLVAPGDVEGSALPLVVTGACMELWMPYGCYDQALTPCIPEADIERLRSWIASPNPFL